ncbi:MAG TPA: efflux RND transporter periplasmic adaptor subunit [Polyangiaceae bacterium]
MKISNILAMVVLAASVAVTPGCKKTDAKPAAASAKRGAKTAAFPVEVIKVEAAPHEVVVTAPGIVDAFEHIQITARVSGVVDKVSFVEGQELKQNQVLALIDSRRYALSVSSAQAALEKAQATQADTQASLDRRTTASAANPGLIAGEEIETYQTKLRTAQADVDQAREAVKLAQLNLEDSNVKAPTAGIVQTRSVQTGQYVQAGSVIATLLRRDPLLLHFNVATSEAPRLKVDMPVDFTLKESQQKYTGKITLVAGAADNDTRLVPITAQIDPTDKQFWLRPGSFAQVRVNIPSTKAFPMIPQTAARPSDRGFLAYAVEGDTAKEHVLELGLHTPDGMVEVKAGLDAGATLVTKGIEALADGSKVRVVTSIPNAQGGDDSAPATSGGPAGSAAPPGSGHHRRDGAAPAGSTAGGAP